MLLFIDGIVEYLKKIDQKLFLQINTQWTNSFLDNILPVYRDQLVWTPLYLFLLIFMIVNFKTNSVRWLLVVAITMIISDQLSSHIIKPWVGRMRPCQDPDLIPYAKLLLGYCPGNASFTSSHATNHFTAGVFIFYTLRDSFKKWSWLFIIWAATISYAQVYIGVHYPLDVLCGALLGCGIGWMMKELYFSKFLFVNELKPHNSLHSIK